MSGKLSTDCQSIHTCSELLCLLSMRATTMFLLQYPWLQEHRPQCKHATFLLQAIMENHQRCLAVAAPSCCWQQLARPRLLLSPMLTLVPVSLLLSLLHLRYGLDVPVSLAHVFPVHLHPMAVIARLALCWLCVSKRMFHNCFWRVDCCVCSRSRLFSTGALVECRSVCWQGMRASRGCLPVQTPNSSSRGKVVQAGSSDKDPSDSVTARSLRSKRFISSDGTSVPK